MALEERYKAKLETTVIWIATDLAANVLLIVAALHGLAWLKRNKNK